MAGIRFARTGAAAAWFLALSACAIVPGTAPPQAPAPEAWRYVSAPVPAPAPRPDWWEAFGEPELVRLVETAQRNNPDLEAAVQRIAQAAADVRAAGATLLPTVGASGSAARSGRGTSDSLLASWGSSYQAAFDASYEIDLWGANRAAVGAARARVAASVYDRDAAALTLAADVATTWLQYAALGDQIRTSRATLDIARSILEVVETRFRLGAISPLELAQQRGAVASIEASIPDLERQRALTLNSLALLSGEVPAGFETSAPSLSDIRLPVPAPGLPSALLARRPDIARAEAQLAAADADIVQARAAFYPSIRLTAAGGTSSAELASLFRPESIFANLAAGLTAPFFQGGRLEAGLERTEARRAELAAIYRRTLLAAFTDVEDVLAAASLLAEVEGAQTRAAAEAREAYRLAEIRYRAGAIDLLTVLDTQRSLLSAEDTLIRTRLARHNAAVGLYRALGGGWSVAGPGSV
ncbi:MAG: efflux transporter outer membrane subunit [Alphaproteobacteria bacterium]